MLKFCIWCRRGDSNPHELPHTPLKRARLPVPPLRHEVSLEGSAIIAGLVFKKTAEPICSQPVMRLVQQVFVVSAPGSASVLLSVHSQAATARPIVSHSESVIPT